MFSVKNIDFNLRDEKEADAAIKSIVNGMASRKDIYTAFAGM